MAYVENFRKTVQHIHGTLQDFFITTFLPPTINPKKNLGFNGSSMKNEIRDI